MTRTRFVRSLLVVALGVSLAGAAAAAIDLRNVAGRLKTMGGDPARDKLLKEVNAKLLEDGRKHQCSFKTDSDQLAPGCNAKLKKLADALITAKQNLKGAGVASFKFEVSGHTDSSGSAEHNKELSGKRAAVIARELVARGVDKSEIISVGRGSERPLVTPDDTPAKQAKNRRYEIQVR
jgi:OmpA-OmpF porin, OOP family